MLSKIMVLLKYIVVLLLCLGLGGYVLFKEYKNTRYYVLPGGLTYKAVNIGVFTPGEVQKVLVKEGDFVQAGAPIVMLTNKVLEERFSGMDPESVNFSKPDYLELQERISKLSINSTTAGYVVSVLVDEGSYVKESDSVAILVADDTVKFSAVIDEAFINQHGKVFSDKLFSGAKVKIRFAPGVEQEGIVESIRPWILEKEVVDGKTEIVINATSQVNWYSNLNKRVEILVDKDKRLDELVDYVKNLLAF